VGWADEMRVGLMGTTRRVWGQRGVRVRQRIQLVREWRYLHLVVDPIGGRLWHFWSRTMQGSVAATLVEATGTETDLAALVWDRAPSHRDAAVRGKDFPLIEQPSYAPELNPVERVFEELRAHIEGIVYPTIEAKVAAVEAILAELDTDPERIKQLTRWHWIEANLHDLPQNHAA
jgi:transposase